MPFIPLASNILRSFTSSILLRWLSWFLQKRTDWAVLLLLLEAIRTNLFIFVVIFCSHTYRLYCTFSNILLTANDRVVYFINNIYFIYKQILHIGLYGYMLTLMLQKGLSMLITFWPLNKLHLYPFQLRFVFFHLPWLKVWKSRIKVRHVGNKII